MFAVPEVQDDVEGGQRADQQGDREPGAVGEQEGGHRHEGDAVLQQPAQAFQQREGAIARLGAGAMEAVEVLGGVVERQVQPDALAVDEGSVMWSVTSSPWMVRTQPVTTPSNWPANMIRPMRSPSSSAGRSVAQLPPESTTATRLLTKARVR